MKFNGKEIHDLTNKKFGKLIALCIDEQTSNEKGKVYWKCICECGSYKSVIGYALKSGNTKSCGCVQKQKNRERCKKYNKYDLETRDYGVGYTEEGKEFWFDKEDYEKIKKYYWNFDDKGAVCTKLYPNSTTLYLHRLIMDVTEHEVQIDHIKHNRFDNRKSQLRITSNKNNNRNKGLVKRNTTGVTGVYYNKTTNHWYAQIKVDYKIIHLGSFKNKEDAIIARKKAEEKYFGEFSYDNSQKIGNERLGA